MSPSSRQASSGFSPVTMVVILLVGIVSLAGLGVLALWAAGALVTGGTVLRLRDA